MKKIIKNRIHACMLAALFLLQGCFDLTETAYTDIRVDKIADTEDLMAMVASGYTPLRYIMGWHGLFDLMEESADALVTTAYGYYPNNYRDMHFHTWNLNQSQPTVTWNTCYSGINRINMVLSQFDAGTLPASEEKLTPYRHELRALRALYYSILLDTHGNVSVVATFDDQTPTQNTRREVYDFVISELNAVKDLLSEEVSAMTYGRMTKWAAYSLLARVYLNAEVYTGAPQWQACIDACDKIIAGGLFKLEEKYRDVFRTDNHTSKEIIFAVPYDEFYTNTSSSSSFSMHLKTLISEHRLVFKMNAAPWGSTSANPQFIDTYDPDDQRHDDTWLYGEIRTYTGELILRTNGYPAFIRKEIPSISRSEFYDGYRLGKYEIKIGAGASLSNDFPYFRYAEILMMKAESILRISEGARANEAADLVNLVRARSFTDSAKGKVTGVDLLADTKYQYGYYSIPSELSYTFPYIYIPPGTTPEWFNPSVTIDFTDTDQTPVKFGGLYDEWGWEFAAEARRRTDMIRFGTFQTKTWFNHRPNTQVGAENIIIFPLGALILTNNKNLRQNLGYPDIAR